MFCMGGPMDTYMEQDYPWLIEENKAIKENEAKPIQAEGTCTYIILTESPCT